MIFHTISLPILVFLLTSQRVQAHDDHNNSWPFREGTQAMFSAQSPIQKAWTKVSNLSQDSPHPIEEDSHPKWKKISNIDIYDYYILFLSFYRCFLYMGYLVLIWYFELLYIFVLCNRINIFNNWLKNNSHPQAIWKYETSVWRKTAHN